MKRKRKMHGIDKELSRRWSQVGIVAAAVAKVSD